MTARYIKSPPLIACVMLLASACGVSVTAREMDDRLGWLDGVCLVTQRADLSPGTPVTVVVLDDPQRLVSTRVLGAVVDDTDCDPLFEDRAAVNRSPDNHFYQVDDPGGELTGMPGIGLLGNAPAVTLIAGRAGVDLNRDGKAEHFELCTTGEGLRFDVRTGDQSPPLWSGYYYLGYDLESSCPD